MLHVVNLIAGYIIEWHLRAIAMRVKLLLDCQHATSCYLVGSCLSTQFQMFHER
jgi:hypothetical protein